MFQRAFNALTLALSLGLAFTAQAQSFPTKPVRIITPFPVGSGPEGVARLVADKLSKSWGQPVTVETAPVATASSPSMPSSAARPMAPT